MTIDLSMGPTLGEAGNLVAGGDAPSPGWQLDQELRVASGETVSNIQLQAFQRMVRAYSAPWRKALEAYRPAAMSQAWQMRINLQTDWLNIVERQLLERGRKMAVSATKPPAWNAFVVKVASLWPPVIATALGELSNAARQASITTPAFPAYDALQGQGITTTSPPRFPPAAQRTAPAAPQAPWPWIIGGIGLTWAAIRMMRGGPFR